VDYPTREILLLRWRQGKSCVELLDRAIARIETLDGKNKRRRGAAHFERAARPPPTLTTCVRAGERRPLLGVPMTVKEAFSVAAFRRLGNPRH